MLVNISQIKIHAGRRPVNRSKVRELADSIQEIGLINPITVTKDRTLISGAHRLEAYKLLGNTEIPANFMDIAGLQAELAEIDENLIRNELHYTERSDQLLRRKEIYEALHPETKREATLKQNRSDIMSERTAPSFAADTAEKTGVSERTVEREIRIAKNLTPKVKAVIREADIPKADALKVVPVLPAGMKPEEQKAVAEKIACGEAKSVVDARRKVLKDTILAGYEEKSGTQERVDIFTTVKKYRIIYADPPWSYHDARSGQGTTGATDHYPVMSLKDICALPIAGITEEHAVLFLWVTSPLLETCFAVIRAWGFTYKACFVWDKIKHNMGHYNSVRHEFLLLCTKGSCVPDNSKLYDSVQAVERGGHSKKPEAFRRIIDALYGRGNRIELFARHECAEWDAWGYE